MSGLEIIKQISEMPVDEKARPLKPVVIVSCGELELRKAPPKPREPSASYLLRWFNLNRHSCEYSSRV